MSRDGRYILSYEYQPYTTPTPMELDKALVREQSPHVEFNDLDDTYTVHFQMPKYTLSHEIIARLKADKVLEAIDGDSYKELPR